MAAQKKGRHEPYNYRKRYGGGNRRGYVERTVDGRVVRTKVDFVWLPPQGRSCTPRHKLPKRGA